MLALKNAYTAIGEITQGAGLMVSLARGLVRDIIAEGISTLLVRIPIWIAVAGATGPGVVPVVAVQGSTLLARIYARVAKVLIGVIKSLVKLLPIIRRLDDLIKALRQLLRQLKRTPRGSTTRGGTGPAIPNPHPHSTDEVEDIVQGMMEADTPQPGHPGGAPHLNRGHSGEQDMGFHYNQEKGWAFLEGPSGAGGHQSNASGFDGVAFKTDGPLEIHILDNKSLKSDGNVSSSTALTDNLRTNLDRLAQRANDPAMNDVPRIQEVRKAIAEAQDALANGRPLPDHVKIAVTNHGGQSTGVTKKLEEQGVVFNPPN
jgi:hypothetical protein